MKRILGCVLIFLACGRPPQTHFYNLHLPQPAGKENVLPVTLFIRNIAADAPYQQDHLLFRDNQYEIQFDPYRRWVDPPQSFMQKIIADYLNESGAFRSVVTSLPSIDDCVWSVSIQIKRFEESTEKGPRQAQLALAIELLDLEKHKIIWQGTLQASKEINSSAPSDIIKSMSEATADVLQQFVELCKQQVAYRSQPQ
jgi:ABC-type uncharacterized transport system auxiliary subunit